jgi:hypothetical protein
MGPSDVIEITQFFWRLLQVEKDSAAAQRLLLMEISLNREVISVAGRAETNRGKLLALGALKTDMLMLVISRSNIFARLEDKLKDLEVPDYVDITPVGDEASPVMVKGIDVLERAAKRITAIHALIAVADHLPDGAYRIDVRMRNLSRLLENLSGALAKSPG